MKDRTHAWHFFRGTGVDFLDLAVGDRRFHWNGIQNSGKVEVGGVLRCSGYLQWAIDAWCFAADR